VLGFLTSDLLVKLHPQFGEGRLSQLKSRIVSSAHLHEVAIGLGLGEFLRMGKGEVSHGGRAKRALLADAVEALIAAIYRDGGLEASRFFVDRFVLTEQLRNPLDDTSWAIDPKSALNELAHARKLATPKYVLVAESGPVHAKTFTVEARVGAEITARAQGPSKKAASSRAAEALLEKLRAEESPAG
jgi:ribonuclease-3